MFQTAIAFHALNKMIYYRSTSHGFIGPFEERKVQAWYREGYFYSEMKFRFEGREQTYTLNQLRTLNGIACPFSFLNMTDSLRDHTHTSSSDSGVGGSVMSSIEIMPPLSIEETSKKPMEIIITSRLKNEDAFQFAEDVRLRMESNCNTRSAICAMVKGDISCHYYSSSYPREQHIYEQNEIWRVRGFLREKKVSFLTVIADRQRIFSLLSSVMEATKQKKLPFLSHILLICTGSVEFYSDIRSISRFLERRHFQRIHANDKSFRRFVTRSH